MQNQGGLVGVDKVRPQICKYYAVKQFDLFRARTCCGVELLSEAIEHFDWRFVEDLCRHLVCIVVNTDLALCVGVVL